MPLLTRLPDAATSLPRSGESLLLRGRKRMAITIAITVIAMAALFVQPAAAAPDLAPAATPEGAVAQSVTALQAAYAGDCAATRSPDDIGKICSKFVAERGNRQAFMAGPTFSEFVVWIFVDRTDAGWIPAGTAPLIDSPAGPAIPWPVG